MTVTAIQPAEFGDTPTPYAHGTVGGGVICVAGQLAVGPHGAPIAPDDAYTQTMAVLERVRSLLADAGGTMDDLLTMTVYLTGRQHLPGLNRAWSETFTQHRPARATIVTELLADGFVVEIQALAVHRESEQK